MLIRLTPEQVANHWGIIKEAVRVSLPPIASPGVDILNNVLEATLCDYTVCWMSYQSEEGVNKVDALIMTEFLEDNISKSTNLLIYVLFSFGQITEKSWEEGRKALGKYAKANKCKDIVFYTTEASIIKMAKRIGGNADYRFVRIPVRWEDD